MVVSGDVLIRTSRPLDAIPEADVVCYGLWLDASVAKNHGVFVSDRRTPQVLKQMLQKPSVEQLQQLQSNHFYLTDIGVWMLSDRAVELLMQRSALHASLPLGCNPPPSGLLRPLQRVRLRPGHQTRFWTTRTGRLSGWRDCR